MFIPSVSIQTAHWILQYHKQLKKDTSESTKPYVLVAFERHYKMM